MTIIPEKLDTKAQIAVNREKRAKAMESYSPPVKKLLRPSMSGDYRELDGPGVVCRMMAPAEMIIKKAVVYLEEATVNVHFDILKKDGTHIISSEIHLTGGMADLTVDDVQLNKGDRVTVHASGPCKIWYSFVYVVNDG